MKLKKINSKRFAQKDLDLNFKYKIKNMKL